MSKSSEEAALKAYPEKIIERVEEPGFVVKRDLNRFDRNVYIQGYEQAEKDLSDKAKYSSGWDGFYYGKGYEQAEKDLALTWEDAKLIYQISDELETEGCIKKDRLIGSKFWSEVVKRFIVTKKKED